MSTKKILITGGAGCLGTSIIDAYLPKNYQLLIIDNFATGKKQNLPEHKNLKIIEGSITNEKLVDDCIAEFKPDLIINSAAAYKDPSNWSEDTLTNVIGSINIAKSAIKYQIKKIINFQTALCYGRPDKVPIPVTAPTKPFTSYGISKTAGEQFLLSSELNVISLRLANICGPRLAIGPIPTFYTRLKDGKNCFCSDSTRDFIDMEDFLNVLDVIITKEIPTGAYNISTGVGSSIKEVFDEVVAHLNIKAPEVPIVPVGADDVPQVVLDPSHTEKVFEWKPKYNFKQTIKRQLEWYDKYGVTDIFSHLSEPKS
ncbi:MAG: NAD-dependent epimerase/dehydratase family protein [Sphingobacteriaceae bacterium]|nr:NAD-dependent epimerase/dehydratase family protein [Sphingobacteriaceae bacterium]